MLNCKYIYAGLTILILIGNVAIYGQNKDSYLITGRVISENGKANSTAGICIEPVMHNSTQFDRFIICTDTDDNGRFTKQINKNKYTVGQNYFLFVTADTNFKALTTIAPPFDLIRKYDKTFNGKLIKLGNQNLIDVGDVRAQFWYGQANLSFLEFKKAKKNKDIDWGSIILQIKDKKGHIGFASTLSKSDLTEYIDQEKSELKISLPKGSWKVEILNSFEGPKLAESSYFVIKKDTQLENIILRPVKRKK
jgi:hypothetical protein